MEAILYNSTWVETWKIELNKDIFWVEIKSSLIHRLLMLQRANARVAIAHTKSRAERVWSTRKIYRQKWTWRARAWSARSPLRKKGWVAFGPRKERNFTIKMNKQERRLALFSLLSSKAKNNQIKIIEEVKLKQIKTRDVVSIVENIKTETALLALLQSNKDLFKASKNIKNIKSIWVWYLNPMDLLKYKDLIFTKDSLELLEKTYS